MKYMLVNPETGAIEGRIITNHPENYPNAVEIDDETFEAAPELYAKYTNGRLVDLPVEEVAKKMGVPEEQAAKSRGLQWHKGKK